MGDKRFFETQDACELAASIDGLRSPSREEARLRLTCAALTGIIALEGSNGWSANAAAAVANADACLFLLYPPPAEVKP